jgi:hypothetical protein
LIGVNEHACAWPSCHQILRSFRRAFSRRKAPDHLPCALAAVADGVQPDIQTVLGYTVGFGYVSNRVVALDNLLDGFDPEFGSVTGAGHDYLL